MLNKFVLINRRMLLRVELSAVKIDAIDDRRSCVYRIREEENDASMEGARARDSCYCTSLPCATNEPSLLPNARRTGKIRAEDDVDRAKNLIERAQSCC